mgnify:FL=1
MAIEDANGEPLRGVTSCTISIEPDAAVTATLTVMSGPMDLASVPLLTRAVLEDVAASHGLRLVPIEDQP